jgi:hypothetical protein
MVLMLNEEKNEEIERKMERVFFFAVCYGIEIEIFFYYVYCCSVVIVVMS